MGKRWIPQDIKVEERVLAHVEQNPGVNRGQIVIE
jgi:hypothetical protein